MSERGRRNPDRRKAIDAELFHHVGEDESTPEEPDALEELLHSILDGLPPNTHIVVNEDGSRGIVFDSPEEDSYQDTTPQDENEPDQP